MTGATIGGGTAYSSGTSEFTPGLSGFFIAQSLIICVVDHCLFFCPFSLAIALSVDLRLLLTYLVSTNSSYIILDLRFKLIGIQNNKCYIDR